MQILEVVKQSGCFSPCDLSDIEWGFESLVVSAEYGHYDNTYLFGSFLLSAFMLLASVLLLNLVVANFSSTFRRIELRAYQEWCLLRAAMVQEYHQSGAGAGEEISGETALCAVPAPLNLLTTAAAVVEYWCEKMKVIWNLTWLIVVCKHQHRMESFLLTHLFIQPFITHHFQLCERFV
jgi:hypothetical protein